MAMLGENALTTVPTVRSLFAIALPPIYFTVQVKKDVQQGIVRMTLLIGGNLLFC